MLMGAATVVGLLALVVWGLLEVVVRIFEVISVGKTEVTAAVVVGWMAEVVMTALELDSGWFGVAEEAAEEELSLGVMICRRCRPFVFSCSS